MATFLDTNATSHYLSNLVKNAKDKLVIVSPLLKLNDRIKDLLKEQDRMKIDIRVVFGKSELAPQEMNWLHGLESVRTSFSKDLHAKCYLNEYEAIITSMNLYEFSQVNNIEMGIHFSLDEDAGLYRDTLAEVQRIIRNSESIRMTAVAEEEPANAVSATASKPADPAASSDVKRISTSKLAKVLGLKTADLNERFVTKGYVTPDGDRFKITAAGEQIGGEPKASQRFGPYIVWPENLKV